MRLSVVIFFLFIAGQVKGQIKYVDISLAEALQKARVENKLLFFVLEAADCDQCNEGAEMGLSDPALAAKVNDNFIALNIQPAHPDRSAITGSQEFSFGVIFMDHTGAILQSSRRSSTLAKHYLDEIATALSKRGETLQVNELERQFQASRSYGMLELLISKRISLSLPVDDLLDTYVELVPADSSRSPRVIRFLAESAPIWKSRASDFMRKDQQLFTAVWYTMDQPKRSAINNSIRHKSLTKAIREKDRSYALDVALFYSGTYSNQKSRQQVFQSSLLRYHKEVKDTAMYLNAAVLYYDQYLMTVKLDSVRKLDSMNRVKLFAEAPVESVTTPGTNRAVVRKAITYAPIGQRWSGPLNNAAWTFYTMTNDKMLLEKALTWVKRAAEFHNSPEIQNTQGRILYKLGKKEEAVAAINKSIAMKEERKFSTKELHMILDKINNGLPLD